MGPGSARSEASASPFRFENGILTLQLHVQPGAAKTGWAGRHGEHALRLRLAAPAADGRANAACIAFLAEAAAVPRRSVLIAHGEMARDKVVRITGVSATRYHWLEAQWDR